MASPIGDVAVRVGADITDLKRGMAQGSQTVGQFATNSGKHLRKTVNDLAKVGAAAAAAGAALVAGLYVKSAQVIDGQSKLAQSLGTTTATVQALTRSADLNGVSQ